MCVALSLLWQDKCANIRHTKRWFSHNEWPKGCEHTLSNSLDPPHDGNHTKKTVSLTHRVHAGLGSLMWTSNNLIWGWGSLKPLTEPCIALTHYINNKYCAPGIGTKAITHEKQHRHQQALICLGPLQAKFITFWAVAALVAAITFESTSVPFCSYRHNKVK